MGFRVAEKRCDGGRLRRRPRHGSLLAYSASVSSHKALRVLIIDDDDFVRELLVDFMWSLGHEPSIAVDGREGVARFEMDRPDAVITDLVMPGLNGWDVVTHIRRMDARAAIVVVSGGASKLDVERARAESVPLLHKPLRLAELEAALRSVVSA
jgi:CheY-like chemotaxis protein